MARGTCELHEYLKARVRLQPIRPDRPQRGEIGCPSVHLAALDCEIKRAAVGVAHYLFDVQADRVAQDDWHIVAGRALGRTTEHERLAARATRVLDRLRR